MRHTKTIALSACLVSLPFLTGCPGSGSKSSNNGTAPASLAGKVLHVAVTDGAAPFSSTGTYTFTPAGNGNSGTYELLGSGGVQSNIGTYTYSANGNIGTLVEVEQSSTIVNNTLTFTTGNAGTIHSSSPSSGPGGVGGHEDGNFTIN